MKVVHRLEAVLHQVYQQPHRHRWNRLLKSYIINNCPVQEVRLDLPDLPG